MRAYQLVAIASADWLHPRRGIDRYPILQPLWGSVSPAAAFSLLDFRAPYFAAAPMLLDSCVAGFGFS